jgi:hypothetical protein
MGITGLKVDGTSSCSVVLTRAYSAAFIRLLLSIGLLIVPSRRNLFFARILDNEPIDNDWEPAKDHPPGVRIHQWHLLSLTSLVSGAWRKHLFTVGTLSLLTRAIVSATGHVFVSPVIAP